MAAGSHGAVLFHGAVSAWCAHAGGRGHLPGQRACVVAGALVPPEPDPGPVCGRNIEDWRVRDAYTTNADLLVTLILLIVHICAKARVPAG